LDHFARCYRIAAHRRERLIDEALELVSLEVRRDAEINELSRGMRQRLCFAKSLLHEPQVLLLDEPASGLDPAGRVEFREMLRQLHQMERTILISSHILTEMTEFCTSIAILEQGQLLASGRVEEVQNLLQPELRLRVEVVAQAEQLVALLETEADAEQIKCTANQIQCSWSAGRDALPELHRKIVHAGIPVVAFALEGDNLEDLYMQIARHHTA
jgi:ABC-2 type transport system ATP-binding protein